MGMIAIGDEREMMDVGDGQTSFLVTLHGECRGPDSSTLGDGLVVDVSIEFFGDLFVGDGDGGLLEVDEDVVEDCKLG